MKVRTETEQLPTNYKITDVIPYGYLLDPENPQNLLIDEEVSIYVHFIFDEYQRGARIADITKRLSNIGAPSPVRQKQKQGCSYLEGRRSDYWIDGHVNRILKHEIYTGRLPYIRRKRTHLDQEFEERNASVYPEKTIDQPTGRVLDHHPAYITLEQHLQILERLKAEGTTYNRHVVKRYDKPIFAGHIFCGTCSRPMRYQRAQKNGVYVYDYYCCSSKHHRVKNACPQTRYKVDWLKEETWKILYEEHKDAANIAEKINHFLTDESYQAYDQVLVDAISQVVDALQNQSPDQSEGQGLEERLSKLMSERMNLRNAYAVKNLWVSLYANMPDEPMIDYEFIRKYLTKITVFPDRHIEAKLKRPEYKERIFHYLNPQNAIEFVASLE
ncbi:MAG: recombinase family protein [Fusicatenibacter saccharivorans]|nr:recombinase family protein [Fusicatenibacter saccharivorans]MDY4770962.1 recombinase family protein [Lachnospiraceae bacterium]